MANSETHFKFAAYLCFQNVIMSSGPKTSLFPNILKQVNIGAPSFLSLYTPRNQTLVIQSPAPVQNPNPLYLSIRPYNCRPQSNPLHPSQTRLVTVF